MRKRYFAIVDVIAVLAENPNPQVYWRVMKNRLTDEGNRTVTNCNALKMPAADGKQRLTDVVDPEAWTVERIMSTDQQTEAAATLRRKAAGKLARALFVSLRPGEVVAKFRYRVRPLNSALGQKLLKIRPSYARHFDGLAERQRGPGVEAQGEFLLQFGLDLICGYAQRPQRFIRDFYRQRHSIKNTACPVENKLQRGRAHLDAEALRLPLRQNTKSQLQWGRTGVKGSILVRTQKSPCLVEFGQETVNESVRVIDTDVLQRANGRFNLLNHAHSFIPRDDAEGSHGFQSQAAGLFSGRKVVDDQGSVVMQGKGDCGCLPRPELPGEPQGWWELSVDRPQPGTLDECPLGSLCVSPDCSRRAEFLPNRSWHQDLVKNIAQQIEPSDGGKRNEWRRVRDGS